MRPAESPPRRVTRLLASAALLSGALLATVSADAADAADAAANTAAALSIDGGLAATRWRGSGTGAVASQVRSGPFAGVGLLALQVDSVRGTGAAGSAPNRHRLLTGLDLRDGPGERAYMATPSPVDGVVVERDVALLARHTAQWLDRFTNIGSTPLRLSVVWAAHWHALSLLQPAAPAAAAATTGVGARVERFGGEPGQAELLLGSPGRGAALRPQRFGAALLPALTAYPGSDGSMVGYRFVFELLPGQTRSLLVFARAAAANTAAAPIDLSTDAVAAHAALPPRTRARLLNWHSDTPARGDTLDLRHTSIQALREHVMTRRWTVEELARLYLARIAAHDRQGATVRAYASLDPALLEHARALDASWRSLPTVPPLLGSFVAVKDNIAVAGLPLTLGLAALSDLRPLYSAELVERLRAKGALVIGKANLDELAGDTYGLSSHGGVTRNVFADGRSTGGSSGGPAAAVAGGLATFALGTDTCDSILQPAAQAALVGLRGTHGKLPMHGIAPLYADQDVAGPLAAGVADARAVAQALAAPVAGSAAEPGRADAGQATGHPTRLGALRPGLPRLGLLRLAPGDALSDPPIAALQQRLSRAGWGVVRLDFDVRPHTDAVEATSPDALIEPALVDALATVAPGSAERLRTVLRDPAALLPGPRGPRSWAPALASAAPQDAERSRVRATSMAAFRDTLVALMERYRLDALAFATVRGAPSLVGSTRYAPGACELSGYTGLPAVTVPVGTLAGTPWPAGLTLLGRHDADLRLLDLAAQLQAHTAAVPAPAIRPRR